jgi:hypothetical protein
MDSPLAFLDSLSCTQYIDSHFHRARRGGSARKRGTTPLALKVHLIAAAVEERVFGQEMRLPLVLEQ